METLRCLEEAEMNHLSREIPHTSYSRLCIALGYSFNRNQLILANHQNKYDEAMENILNMWKNKQTDTSQSRLILATKLHDEELGDLGVKLSKGEYLPNQEDPREQHATPLQSGSDIDEKNISKSLTVLQCRRKLEKIYRDSLCKIQKKPWDKNDYAEFEDMHMVVTTMKKDTDGKDTNVKVTLPGSVAEIFSTKVKGRLPARILISAPAGRGKTTAVAKMAYDWVHRESGSALEHLPLLFVVKFRNTSQLTSIGEAIKSQLLSDVDDLTPEGLESFIRQNQGICHIILDGLDEYAGISSSNRSSESNIVSVIRCKEFPECRVLVTTRPHLDLFFDQDDLPRVYTKMWIEGFSRESSREYIDKFFASTSNPSSEPGHGLKVYLDDQPLIDELVKTPLFCLMVCHLWSDGSLNTETATQTELIDSVNNFLMQHANSRSKSTDEITKEELIEIIRKLGKVSLAGLIDDSKKLVFTTHDFRKVPAILDRACELGILSKTTIATTMLPRSHKTTSTTIEFYHKLAQEHSAGKYLAAKTKKYKLRLNISKLDTLLHKIKSNIGDYENLIRFTAGTDNSLCIRIMEALLSNRLLDESERYRILLDCSSETKDTEGNVSSLVTRFVNAHSIVLKAPTVFTVVGMQNLPKQLKRQVRSVQFERSTLSTDVTSGLWSCLEAFSMLHTLIISDTSLSFLSSPPELLSVTNLSAENLTSQSYEGVLSSVPGVRDIDVSIDNAETTNTFQITTASRPLSQTRARDEHSHVHIRLHAWPAPTTERKIESGETVGGLSLFFEDQTKNQQRLHVSGIKGRDEEALVDLFVKTKQLKYLNSWSGGGSLNQKNDAQKTRLKIEHCHLSTEMTGMLWSSLRSYTPLNQLAISDSSLSFPPSPPELPSVTELSVERVTSQSYEGLLSSLPDLGKLYITLNDAEKDVPEITACLHQMGKQLTTIRLEAPTSLSLAKKEVSRETLKGLGLVIREHTKNLQWLGLSGMKYLDEEDLVELVESSTYLELLDSLHLQSIDDGCFHYDSESDVQWLYFTRREHEKVLEGFARRTENVLPSSTETLPGETVSSPQRPSESTSVDIPLQDASVAASEVSTSQARCSMVTSDDNECGRIQHAAWKGETESIRSLVEDGRDIDEQVEGNSEGNAIVNKADNNSGFPLNLAVELQNEDVMKVPLASDAQPDALNNEGKGALHDACIKGDFNAITVVINAGADVDIKLNHHSTPLLLAAENCHHSPVEKLVTHGADPTQMGNDGDSLVHVASSGLNSEVNAEFDGILKKIARALYKHSDIDELGSKLGFQPADIGRYYDANAQQGGNWMGTLKMLRTWQEGQTESKQKAALRSALIHSGFQKLADEHLSTCSAGGTVPEHLQNIGDSHMPSGIDSTPAAPGSSGGQTKTHDITAATDQLRLHDQSSENHGDETSECMEQHSENSSINNLADDEQNTPSGVSSKEPFDEGPDTSDAKGVEHITTNYSDYLSYLALTETSPDKLLMLFFMKVFVDVWFGSFGR